MTTMNCRLVAFVGERVFDLRQPTKTAPVNPILEKMYAKKKTPDNSTIQVILLSFNRLF